MERQKRNTRKKVQQQVEPIVDDHHSLETPPCNLVIQVVSDVIPSEANTSEASLFGTLVLQHMLEERRNRNRLIKQKPKKRRKKKNKNNADMHTEENDSAVPVPAMLQPQLQQSKRHPHGPHSLIQPLVYDG